MSRIYVANEASGTSAEGPRRTCVGCRVQDSLSALVRFYVDPEDGITLVPDPERRGGGRGAWLHPRTTCFSTAKARHAFGRAFRKPTINADALEHWIKVRETSEMLSQP